jgi:hypothetical protein
MLISVTPDKNTSLIVESIKAAMGRQWFVRLTFRLIVISLITMIVVSCMLEELHIINVIACCVLTIISIVFFVLGWMNFKDVDYIKDVDYKIGFTFFVSGY